MTPLTPAQRAVLSWAIKAIDRDAVATDADAKAEFGRVFTDAELVDTAQAVDLDCLRRALLFTMAEDGALWRSTATVLADLKRLGWEDWSSRPTQVRGCLNYLVTELKLLERTTFKDAYGSGIRGRGLAWRLSASAHKIVRKFEPRNPHSIQNVTVSAGVPVARRTTTYYKCPFCAWDAKTPCPEHANLCVVELEEGLCGKPAEGHSMHTHHFVELKPEEVPVPGDETT